MSSNTIRISLSDLASAGVVLNHSDAVTIAREAALRAQRGIFAAIPSPDDLRLSSDGEIENVGIPAPGNEIRRAARLLAALLAHAEQDVSSPATFRLILARAFADDEAAYESVDQFLAALAPFAVADSGAVVREVVAKWRGQTQVNGSLDEFGPEPAAVAAAAVPLAAAAASVNPPPSPVKEPVVDRDRVIDGDVVVNRAPGSMETPAEVAAEEPAGVAAVTQPEPIHPTAGSAILAGEPRRELSAESGRPVQPRRYSRRSILALAVAALLAGLLPAFWFSSRSGPEPTTADDSAATNPAASGTPDKATAPEAGAPQQTAVPQAATSPSEKVQQEAASPGPASPSANQTPPSPPPAPSVATSGASAPGKPTATEVIREAAFSPSFASAASGMFYHSGTGPGSAIMRADTDNTGMVLRVTSVVDDRGSNFHPRPSPDGKLLAFDSDRDGERGVYVADSNGRDVRRVSGPGFAAVPSWSPDGRHLAFVRAEEGKPRVWNIWTVDMSNGNATRVTSHRMGQPWGAAWFPDGDRIAYSHEDRLIIRTLQGKDVRVFKSPIRGRLVRTPAVSPDGKRIIFQVRRDGAWMLDVASGHMSRVLEDPSAEEFTWSPDGKRVAYHSRRSGAWGVWMMAPR